MKFIDKQTPTTQPDLQQEARSSIKPFAQNRLVADDNEEDPISTEGYLPEIYFSLRSENPADW